MILNELLGNSDRIEILESFLANEKYGLTLEDIKRISEISNPLPHLNTLIKIGILFKKEDEYYLNQKDKRVICLSLIDNEEYSRKLNVLEQKGIFKEVKEFSQNVRYTEQ